jgi:hypothetical protein
VSSARRRRPCGGIYGGARRRYDIHFRAECRRHDGDGVCASCSRRERGERRTTASRHLSGQHLVSQQRPDYAAGEGRKGASELVRYHEARYDSHREVDREYARPEEVGVSIDRLTLPDPECFEDDEVARQPDGNGGEDYVERDGEAELDARQIERSQARYDFAPGSRSPWPPRWRERPASLLLSAAREAIVSSDARATRPAYRARHPEEIEQHTMIQRSSLSCAISQSRRSMRSTPKAKDHYNVGLSISWRDVISHLPIAIPC